MCSSYWNHRVLAALFLALAATASPPATPAATAQPGRGKVLLTTEEALKLAFPECEIERATTYLTDAHKKRVAELSKVDFASGVIYSYTASKGDKLVGTAYFDSHRVRTKREVLMVVVSPDRVIQRIEVLSFAEPREYLPRGEWYEQFRGCKLDDDLSLKRKIRGVTGATLTARATTTSARRMLAVDQLLEEIKKAKEEEEKKRERQKKKKKKETDDPATAPIRPGTGG